MNGWQTSVCYDYLFHRYCDTGVYIGVYIAYVVKVQIDVQSAHEKTPLQNLQFQTNAYIYITLFHQLNGSIKIQKKYINKYNTTKKERKEEKNNILH